MSRRTAAGLLALGLIAVLAALAVSKPVTYVSFRPGPTLDVLGKFDGETIVEVRGRKTYRDDGALRMVTVYPSGPDQKVSLFNVVYGWANPDISLFPKDAVYKDDETSESVREESAGEMTSSQDNATAAALGALDIDYRTEVEVAEVADDGPSAGTLEKDDVLVAVDGTPVTSPDSLIALVRGVDPGTPLDLTVRRNGTQRDVTVTTEAAPDDPKASRIGVGIGADFVFPFSVDITLPERIGGPSAGMMFALAIYDVLTPGSLTGGRQIAGSGEITPEGKVGAIGGISQKLPSAQSDGAKLFLVAEENCAVAVRSHYDPDKMRLVKVSTLDDAIEAVEAWSKDPDVPLPRCSR